MAGTVVGMTDAGGYPPDPAQQGSVPTVSGDPASLLSLAVAAALSVDTALKQDSRGLS